MKTPILYIKRRPAESVLLFLLLSILAFLLVLTVSLQRIGASFRQSMQDKLGTTIVLTTPFQMVSDFPSEAQMQNEADAFRQILER